MEAFFLPQPQQGCGEDIATRQDDSELQHWVNMDNMLVDDDKDEDENEV